jgi:2,4-dienoyl-CoA reductase-like NADH-dependent reductase (Old Yellow Enzyme family)
MKALFESQTINGMVLSNRFVRSATWAGMADDDGNVTPALIQLMSRLAEGGVGLIITGHAFVDPSGKHAPWQMGIDSDNRIEGLRALAEAVHKHNRAIAVQLGYGGAYLSKSRLLQMTAGDIRLLSEAYASAATRARRAGIDGVQILAAHGFLLSQFLCPRYNCRTDAYGGSLENRSRCLLEVLDAVRRAVGNDYPVMVKLNCHDGIPDGMTLEESLIVAQMLEAGGVDAIEISGGLLNNPNVGGAPSEGRAYFEAEAPEFRRCMSVPLMVVGGIRSVHTARRLVSEFGIDCVSLCRPLICEPALIRRWESGDLSDAACISCNNCVEEIKKGRGVSCVPLQKETHDSFFPQITESISASPPHPAGARYVISFGLRATEARFLPMVEVHMTFPGDNRKHPCYFPPGSRDHEKVCRAIRSLSESHASATDPPPGRAIRT